MLVSITENAEVVEIVKYPVSTHLHFKTLQLLYMNSRHEKIVPHTFKRVNDFPRKAFFLQPVPNIVDRLHQFFKRLTHLHGRRAHDRKISG